MKNILFLLSILLGQPLYGQNQRLGDFLSHLVAPVNKTEITSGYLWDKGTNALAEPAVFDGILRDSACLQPLNFGFLYAQARNSFVGTGTNLLPNPAVYMNYVKRYTGTDTIPLAALTLRYHRIHKNALTDQLFTLQNEQLFDVPGRSHTPYWQDTLCAFVPLKSDAWHSTVYYTLPADLIWSNLAISAPVYAIDPGDGSGYHTLVPGQTLTIQYSEGGEKIVRTRISGGGLSLETQTVVFVTETLVQERGAGPNYPIGNTEATIPIPGGGGDMRIFYGSPCNKLVKPFILVEGFELKDDPMQFTIRLKKLLVETKKVISTDLTLSLGEWLYAQGYDIVWVNLLNIQDRIQDNAEIVKAAIQKINQIKAENGSSEPNIIMGVSAGGVITKHMFVKTNSVPFDHQCEKFFTYDAPLRGANIPVSIQCLLQHVNYIASANGQDLLAGNPNIALAYSALTSPFAQQTLLSRFYYPANPNNSNDGRVDSQTHDAYMAEVDALGAIPIRHIALSSGSPNNTSRANISPGSLMFNAHTDGSLTTVSLTPGTILLPIFIKVEFDANGFALSETAGHSIYEGDFKVKIDGVVLKHFPLSVSTSENGKAYDTAPGGSSNLAIFAIKSLDGIPVPDIGIPVIPLLNRWVPMSDLSITAIATHYCFVPTRSAISAGESIPIVGTFSCGQGTSDRCTMNTIPTLLPPEYSVSIPEVNQDHVFLDARIGDIIVDEVDAANLIPGGTFPNNLNTYYNAGLPRQSGIPTITITTSNGKLSINNTGKVSYATGNEPNAPLALLNAYTRCNAVVTVEQGASLVIGADNSTKHSVLNVTAGSTIRIKTGGTLSVNSRQSKLIVRAGGTLILEADSFLNLSDPSVPEDGEACIKIEAGGKLRIEGDFKITGNGYIWLQNTPIYEDLRAEIKYTGLSKTCRLLYLDNTELVADTKRLNLDKMEIYCNGSGVKSMNGRVQISNVTFTRFGVTGDALTVDGGPFMNVKNTDFVNFEYGIKVDNHTGSTSPYIQSSLFTNCGYGISMHDSKNMYIINSEFAQSPLEFFNISNLVSMTDTKVTGPGNIGEIPYQGLDDIYATNGFLPVGVYLQDVPRFQMSGGVIQEYNTGIFVPNLSKSNIILKDKATIQNNLLGIFVEAGFQDVVGGTTQTFGSVLMDCARMLDNKVGIFGSNVLLLIDAFTNSGTKNPYYVRSNHFRIQPSDTYLRRLFFICYDQAGVSTVSARGNFWENLEGDYKWRLYNSALYSSPPVGCFGPSNNNVALIRTFAVTEAPLTCPISIPGLPNEGGSPNPPSDDPFACPSPTNSGMAEKLYQQFSEGYKQFGVDAETGEFAASDAIFQPLADMSQSEVIMADEKCRNFVEGARTFVRGYPDIQRAQPGSDPQSGTAKPASLTVVPNPASNKVMVKLVPGIYAIRVRDAVGRLLVQYETSGDYQYFDVSNWMPGLYIVEGLSRDKNSNQQVKLIVE